MNRILEKSSLEKLHTGLYAILFKSKANEPEQFAMDQTSRQTSFYIRRWQYSKELQDILGEMKITLYLVKNTPRDFKFKNKSQKDLFIYYQGVFLDQVYRFQEKLFILITLLIEIKIPENRKIEEDVKLGKFFKDKEKILKNIKIYDLLKDWDYSDNSKKNNIKIALQKRTNHTHYISSQYYDSDLQEVSMLEFFLDNQIINEKLATQKHIKALSELKRTTINKLENTLNDIEKNINSIATALNKYFNVPIEEKEIKEAYISYYQMIESLKIVNKASFDNVSKKHKEYLDKKLIFNIKDKLKDNLETIYLVGSIVRNEYIDDLSDINIFVITKKEYKGEELSFYDKELNSFIDINIISKDKFLSEEYKKESFICYSDGLVIDGDNIIKNIDFPKPGFNLAYLLNKDFFNEILIIKEWLTNNIDNYSEIELNIKIKRILKGMINLFYGIAICNRSGYFTHSRTERFERIKSDLLGSDDIMKKIQSWFNIQFQNIDDLKTIIEWAEEQLEPFYKQLKDLKKAFNERKTKPL